MKAVRMIRDYTYRTPTLRRMHLVFVAGELYPRATEAQAAAIVAAGAGEIVTTEQVEIQ